MWSCFASQPRHCTRHIALPSHPLTGAFMFTYNTKWCGLVPLGCGSNNELSALSLSIYLSISLPASSSDLKPRDERYIYIYYSILTPARPSPSDSCMKLVDPFCAMSSRGRLWSVYEGLVLTSLKSLSHEPTRDALHKSY